MRVGKIDPEPVQLVPGKSFILTSDDIIGDERRVSMSFYPLPRVVKPGDRLFRYFDPSYQIRGCPANTEDSLLCDRMGRHAVHAAMSGRTGLVISFLHGHFVHVPIDVIAAGGKKVDLEGELWRAVLSSTGQPARFA